MFLNNLPANEFSAVVLLMNGLAAVVLIYALLADPTLWRHR